MENRAEIFENLRQELRRGSLILAVLAQLRAEQYGYVLRKSLADMGLAIDENTLYPLLRRLETQGLLVSQWREKDKRNKRFYRLSADGEAILSRLLAEHEAMNAALDRILHGTHVVRIVQALDRNTNPAVPRTA
jgi:PadR family transcriptional regulator, regulatory protein PadR